jgi:LAO/AO transport system kinase
MENSWENLVDGVKKRDIRAVARLITRVENRESGWEEAMKAVYPDTGSARVFGITGSPGVGKSSLTSEISMEFVNRGLTVGIIAVDPSSPFSGGALLGDRLRMKKIFTMKEIFIRSMATRGALGGLNQAARDVVRILDAYGKDIILIETVGVGQDEIEVVKTADLVMVVCIPGQGDGIQAIKAGIMEIADFFIINKADMEGADAVMADIMGMLELSGEKDQPLPPVVKTSAMKGEGIKELVSMLLHHKTDEKKYARRRELGIREEIINLVKEEIFLQVLKKWEKNGELEKMVNQVIEKKKNPYTIVQDFFCRDEGL